MARGLTQGELAARARLGRSTIVRIESERRWPRHSQRILAALNLTRGDELLAAAAGTVSATERIAGLCAGCRAPLTSMGPRRGRPRLFCDSCASPSAVSRRWRAQHRAAHACHSEAR